MIYLQIILACVVFVQLAHAQAPSPTDYRVLNLAGVDDDLRLAVDAHVSRVYVAGAFTDSLVVGGLRLTSRGDLDGFILAMDYDLQPLWLQQFGGPGRDAATTVRTTNNGGVVVGGYCGANSAIVTTYTIGTVIYSGRGEADPVIMRIDDQGVVTWSRNDGGPNPDGVRDLTVVDGNSIVVGSFVGTARFDTVSVGINNGLQHAYVQVLDTSGHQQFVQTVLAEKTVDMVSSAHIPNVTAVAPDDFYAVLRFAGTVVVGSDTLQRGQDGPHPQILVQYQADGTYRGHQTQEVCTDEASAWSATNGSKMGVYAERDELCSTTVSPRVQYVNTDTWQHQVLALGSIDVQRISAYHHAKAMNDEYLIAGSFNDTCDLVETTTSPDVVNTNGASDGILMCKGLPSQARWAIPLRASVRGTFTEAEGTAPRFFAIARAEGAVGLLPDTPELNWNQRIVMKFVDPALDVVDDLQPRVAVSPIHAGEPLSVYTVGGNLVSPNIFTLQTLPTLPVGTYILRWAKGLSLCHVGSYYIAFPVSAFTSRQGP